MLKPPSHTLDKRRARTLATRTAILDAAEALVTEDGIGALTTKALVDKAGVSERTIFNHFSHIDHILIARITEYITPLFNSDCFSHEEQLHVEKVEDLPDAIEAKFLASILEPEVQSAPNKFFTLASAMAQQNHRLLAENIFQLLMRASVVGMERLEKEFPQLTVDQRYKIGIYLHNLTFALGAGFGRGVETLCDTDNPLSMPDIEEFIPHFKWAIQQVNQGKPTL